MGKTSPKKKKRNQIIRFGKVRSKLNFYPLLGKSEQAQEYGGQYEGFREKQLWGQNKTKISPRQVTHAFHPST